MAANKEGVKLTLDSLEFDKCVQASTLRELMEQMLDISKQEKQIKLQRSILQSQINDMLYVEFNCEFSSITDPVFGSVAIVPECKGPVSVSRLQENMINAGIPVSMVEKIIDDSRSIKSEHVRYNAPGSKNE